MGRMGREGNVPADSREVSLLLLTEREGHKVISLLRERLRPLIKTPGGAIASPDERQEDETNKVPRYPSNASATRVGEVGGV